MALVSFVFWHHGVVVDRRNLTMRDMAVAIGVLVVSLVAVVGAMGLLSFGNDTDSGEAPTADVIGGFDRAAAALKLPLAVPHDLPASWHGNSFSQVEPFTSGGTRTVVRGGWLTDTGAFITLIQSPETPADLVGNEIKQGTTSTATVEAGAAEWAIYPGQRTESAWVRTRDGVSLLITGSATEADFQTLAAAIS